MKFTVPKAALVKELELLTALTDEQRNRNIPVLSHVLIESKDLATLSLAATDLETTLKTVCVALIAEPGAFLLPASRLLAIVSSLPGPPIVFEQVPNSDMVRITSEGASFELLGMDKNHSPTLPASPSELPIQLYSSMLHSLITRTIYAITEEESRYALNASLLTIQDGELRLVSCDGHRLAIASAPVKWRGEDVSLLVPKKALGLLETLTRERAIETSEDLPVQTAAGWVNDVEFGQRENLAFFKVGERELSAIPLAGQFPNYHLVIPKDNDRVVTLEADELAAAITRALLMADERSGRIFIEVRPGEVICTAMDCDFGRFDESINADYFGGNLKTSFKADYLLDFLNTVAGERISLALKADEEKADIYPALVRALDGSDYRYVVMQMKVL